MNKTRTLILWAGALVFMASPNANAASCGDASIPQGIVVDIPRETINETLLKLLNDSDFQTGIKRGFGKKEKKTGHSCPSSGGVIGPVLDPNHKRPLVVNIPPTQSSSCTPEKFNALLKETGSDEKSLGLLFAKCPYFPDLGCLASGDPTKCLLPSNFRLSNMNIDGLQLGNAQICHGNPRSNEICLRIPINSMDLSTDLNVQPKGGQALFNTKGLKLGLRKGTGPAAYVEAHLKISPDNNHIDLLSQRASDFKVSIPVSAIGVDPKTPCQDTVDPSQFSNKDPTLERNSLLIATMLKNHTGACANRTQNGQVDLAIQGLVNGLIQGTLSDHLRRQILPDLAKKANASMKINQTMANFCPNPDSKGNCEDSKRIDLNFVALASKYTNDLQFALQACQNCNALEMAGGTRKPQPCKPGQSSIAIDEKFANALLSQMNFSKTDPDTKISFVKKPTIKFEGGQAILDLSGMSATTTNGTNAFFCSKNGSLFTMLGRTKPVVLPMNEPEVFLKPFIKVKNGATRLDLGLPKDDTSLVKFKDPSEDCTSTTFLVDCCKEKRKKIAAAIRKEMNALELTLNQSLKGPLDMLGPNPVVNLRGGEMRVCSSIDQLKVISHINHPDPGTCQ